MLGCDLREQGLIVRSAGREIEAITVDAPYPRIAQVHHPAVRTPCNAIGAADAADDFVCAVIALEAIYGAARLAGVGEILGTGPEAAGAIDFAVVEAIARQMRFRIEEGSHRAVGGIEQDETGAHRGDQAAGLAQADASCRLGHQPAVDRPSVGVEALDQLAFDVDPIQRLLGNAPDRTFADGVAGGDGYARRSC